MSFPKDQGGLLGAIIPNVVVDSITLESGGEPPQLSDPHIEHQWETKSARSTDPGTLKLVVDSSIKEVITDEPISDWFGNKFARYVKLTVFVTTNPAITAAFSSSNDGITILNHGFALTDDSPALRVLNAAFKDEPDLQAAIMRHSQIKEFNIYTDVISDELASTQHMSSVDSDGNIIHDVNFRSVFDIVGSEPTHLSIFAMTHLDMKQLVEDYNLTVDEQTLKSQNGKIVSEVIVNNGKVVSEAFLFRKLNNVAWLGPVHDVGNGTWATGDRPNEDSEPLVLNRVTNNKIQDFRNVDKLERLHIDLSTMENQLFSGKADDYGFLKRKKNTLPPRNVYFSELYLAKDRQGNARMSFAVDYQKMLRENSAFESLFMTANTQQRIELTSSCRIKNMTVLRRRVKEVKTMNKLGNPAQGEVLFDKDQAPFSVVSSAETSLGVFGAKKNPRGEIREAFYSVDMSKTPVRFFNAVDKNVSSATDGIYQYGVEMTIEDASQKYIYSLVRLLRHHRSKLHDYYLESEKLGMSKYIVELQDPHIDDSRWERAAANRSTPASFSPASGRFTNDFILKQYEKYDDRLGDAPWVSPIIAYFTILNLFTGFANQNQSGAFDVLMSVVKYADPYSGSPKGIMAIIKMMDKLISRVSLIVGSDVPLGEGESKLYRSAGSSSSSTLPTKTTKITHWFADNNFDSNFFRTHGWDYLSNHNYTTSRYDGLRSITGAEYSARAVDEVVKYFTDEFVSLDIDGITTNDSFLGTGFGYLTPGTVHLGTSKVHLGNVGISQAGELSTADQCSAIEASIMTLRSYGAPNTTPVVHSQLSLSPSAQLYQANMLSHLSKLNMTVMDASSDIARPMTDAASSSESAGIDAVVSRVDEGGYKEIVDKNINANAFMLQIQSDLRTANRYFDGSTSHPFGNSGTTTASTGPAGLAASTIMEVGTITSFNMRQNENVINHMYKSEQYLKEVANLHGSNQPDVPSVVKFLPNQVKGLLVASTNPSVVQNNWHQFDYDVVKDPRTASQFTFLYKLINRVEVLVSYNKNVKDGEWRILSHDYWEGTQGQELICRMIPYECRLFGISRPKSLNISTYDEHFILKPKTITTRSELNQSQGQVELQNLFDSGAVVSQLIVSRMTAGTDVNDPVGATTTNVTGVDGPTSASHPCGDELSAESGVGL